MQAFRYRAPVLALGMLLGFWLLLQIVLMHLFWPCQQPGFEDSWIRAATAVLWQAGAGSVLLLHCVARTRFRSWSQGSLLRDFPPSEQPIQQLVSWCLSVLGSLGRPLISRDLLSGRGQESQASRPCLLCSCLAAGSQD